MPTQTTPYDFAPAIRARAEELRMANVRQAVKGSIQAHSITADKIAVGVLNVGSGAVTVDNGALFANMMAANVLRVGPTGAVVVDDDGITAPKLNVATLDAITANMGTLTAGTINGGQIISGSGSPQATFGPDGIVLTNARTAENVNHSPSHVDFYSDSGADSEQKGALACFIGNSDVNYAPHLTVRALCPTGSYGRASLSAWVGTDERATISVYPTGTVNARIPNGNVASLVWNETSGKASGSWPDGDVSALAFHSLPSDREAKRKIRKLGGSLDAIKALKPVSYELKMNGEAKVGFVAQDVQTVLPGAVSKIPTARDPKTGVATAEASGLDLVNLLTHAIGSIQELAGRIEALERK